MTTVELIFDDTCPNVEPAREQLRTALTQLGLPLAWTEWRRDDPASPPYVRQYGSPTVLVDGRDVVRVPDTDGAACCRLYSGPDGMRGTPSSADIARAIAVSQAPNRRVALAAIPSAVLSLLPVVTCPSCWPGYAAILSSLGIGAIAEARVVLPLTFVFLAIALGSLAYTSRRTRKWLPLVVGVVGAAAIVIGKFAITSDGVLYAGVAVLTTASLWSSVGRLSSLVPVHAFRKGVPT
ncbi:MAG: MerC domain-containing protein [Myxococcota bacterium]